MPASTELYSHYTTIPIPLQTENSGTSSDCPALEKEGSHGESDESPSLSRATLLAVIALAVADVGTNVAGYFSGSTIHSVVQTFGVDMADGEWMQITPSLIFACTAPIVGYLSDIYGRRNAVVLGILADILGPILVAAAPNFGAAIVGQVFSGFGQAVTELTAVAAIAELVPVRKRGIFLALATSLTLPFVPSVIYGELLAEHLSWRWCYGLAAIWNALALVGVITTYWRLKLDAPTHKAQTITYKDIDYMGILLVVAGSVLLIVGIENGGAQVHPWNSAYTLVPLLVGILLLVLLLVWEGKWATTPLIPFRLFGGGRCVLVVFGIAFISGMYFQTADSLGPLIITEVFNTSPLDTGLYTLGPSFAIFTGAVSFNIMLSLFRGSSREITCVAGLIALIFTGAQASASPSALGKYVGLATIAGIGYGGLLEPATTIVSIACPQDLIGTAISLIASIRTIGAVVGYSIFTSVALGKGSNSVPDAIGAAAIEAGLNPKEVGTFVQVLSDQGTAAASKLPGVTSSILEAAGAGSQWGYWTAYQTMFYSQIPFGVVIVILCLALPNISKLMTNKVVTRST